MEKRRLLLSSPMIESRFGGGCVGSETGRPWRRAEGGAGAGLRRTDADGEGGSGVLPAASRSKTDSRSDSWLALDGAGGSGLLRSVSERCVLVDAILVADSADNGDNPGLGVYGECSDCGLVSSFSCIFMSFPCRELGGGGLFLPEADRVIFGMLMFFRSSSGSDTSWDVRRDSGSSSGMFSKIECRETDDASVLFPSVNPTCDGCAITAGEVAGAVGSLLPVMSRRLKASTSMAAFPAPVTGAPPLNCFPSVRSNVANVLLNGFNSFLPPPPVIGNLSSSVSFDDSSVIVDPNGSWPSAWPSSPWGGGACSFFRLASSSGLTGGGDCTLTCFTGFPPCLIAASVFGVGASIGNCCGALSCVRTPFSVGLCITGLLRRKGFEEM